MVGPLRWIVVGCLLALLGACASTEAGDGGPRPWKLTFEGASAFGASKLEEVVAPDFETLARRSSPRSAVDDAAFSVEVFYRSQGFPFVRVEYVLQSEAADDLRATLKIDAGPRISLGKVTFEGNRAFSGDELRSLFIDSGDGLFGGPTWYVERKVEAAARAVAALYLGRGYLDARVDEPVQEVDAERGKATVAVRIQEGPLYRLSRLEIEGGVDEVNARLDREGIAGEPYTANMARKITGELFELYGRAGYADAEVNVTEVSRDGGAVHLIARIEAGPRVTIGSIRVEGNDTTSRGAVLRRMELKEGGIWDVRKERMSFRQLYRSGLFASVELGLVEGSGEVRDMLVTVTERASLEFYVEPGYGSYERFRLGFGLRERNLFGAGLVFDMEGTVGQLAQDGLISLSDARFLGSSFRASVSLFANRREEPSFEARNLGSTLTFSRAFSEEIDVALSYQFRRSEVDSDDLTDPFVQAALDNVDISSIILSPTYDDRDHRFLPTRGSVTRASVECGTDLLGSELDFVRARINHSRFLPLREGTVLGLSWRAGTIAPIQGTNTIPVQERFFNGGENTVRSFKEDELGPLDSDGDPVGGEAYHVGSLELRQRLTRSFEGALFYDAGNVVPDSADVLDFRDFRHGIGVGVRYLLPVGPVRLDLGWNPDPRANEDDLTLHLSVGFSF